MSVGYLKKIFLILFLDLLAYSAIFPLLPLLFLDSKFFLLGFTQSQKVLFLGLVYAAYPLFQMIFSPLWVKLSDRIGRKKMLQMSFLGNCLGYMVSCLAILKGDFRYLFLGQAIAGSLGVNLSTINALISDLTQGTKRVKYFGIVNLLLGGAFALGPYISSLLVPKLPHVETLVLFIFAIAALMAILNLILITSISSPLPIGLVAPKTTLDFKGVKKEAIQPLFVIFLTTFAWYIFIKTFQIFLLQTRHYSPEQVLKIVSFYGLSTVASQAAFVTRLYKRINHKLSLYISVTGLACAISLFVISPGFIGIHCHILAIAFFQSVITPNLLALFSKNHTPEIHGKMMSAHLGVVSLAKILAPATSGILVALGPSVSLMTSASVIFGSCLLLPSLFKTRQQNLDQV